ncbi:MAG: 3'(2'),5'-bisphosphate nucleotidase CysQ [Bacteroidota bacterium]
MNQFPEIYKSALRSAVLASVDIMKIYREGFEASLKSDGSPVTEADIASSKVINALLAETLIPITGEESIQEEFEHRKDWDFSWCVDPLDGTKEFVKRNDEFCINIALIKQSTAIFGLIASPVQRKVLFGGREIGVFFAAFEDIEHPHRWEAILPSHTVNSPVVMTGSRSHHSGDDLHFIQKIEEKTGTMKFLRMGSALKFFDLAHGTADVYPRFAPTMEWDIAAGQAILEALGGCVLDAETMEPLQYNKSNLKNPFFVAKTKAFLEWENQ